jgi:hypothetical protein
MRNLLAFLAAVCLTLIIAGWYLNWYTIHSVPSADGHRKWSIDVNTHKAGQDMQRGGESFWNFLEKARKPEATTEERSETPPEPKPEPPKKDASTTPPGK